MSFAGVCSLNCSHDEDNLFFSDFPIVIRNSVDTLCNNENTAYLILFTIEGGDLATYNVDGPGTLTGDQFVSDFIVSGEPFQFIITDANQCGADTVRGVFSCECSSSIGLMRADGLYFCHDDTLFGTDFYNPVGQVILGNDVRNYILSSDETNPLESIELSNQSGVFHFDPLLLNFGQTYYVSVIIGKELYTGQVDLSDPCLLMTMSLSITWYNVIDDLDIGYSALEISCDHPFVELFVMTQKDTTGFSIHWKAENGGEVFQADSFLHEISINQPGRYIVEVYHPIAGCLTSTHVDITASTELPVVQIENPELLTCTIEEIVLSGAGSTTGPNIVFEWNGPGILTPNYLIDVQVNEPGIYRLTVRDSLNDCEVTQSVLVDENRMKPIAIATASQMIDCDSEVVGVLGQGSSVGLDFTYQWRIVSSNGNIIGPTTQRDIETDSPGAYELEVYNRLNGCVSTDTAFVEFDENIITGANVIIEQPACSGASDGSIMIDPVFGGIPPFEYSFDGEVTVQSENFINELSPDIYLLSVRDSNGCEFFDTVTLTAPFDFEVELGEDIIIGQGETVNLIAETNLPDSLRKSVIWTPFYDSLSQNLLTQTFNPDLGHYKISVLIENNNGCFEQDEINVFVRFEKRFFIPNAFYPGSKNSANRTLNIYTDPESVSIIRRFEIVNRWGNRVFQRFDIPADLSANQTFAWDGRFEGQALNPGVFVYIAEIEFLNGTSETILGEINLIR